MLCFYNNRMLYTIVIVVLFFVCFAATDNIGLIIINSASLVQCPASTVAPPLTTTTCWDAALWFATVRDSRTKSTPSTTFLTRNASSGNAKPGISPWITNAWTGLVAATWAGNAPAGIPTRITSPGISATWHARTRISTRSRDVTNARHITGN